MCCLTGNLGLPLFVVLSGFFHPWIDFMLLFSRHHWVRVQGGHPRWTAITLDSTGRRKPIGVVETPSAVHYTSTRGVPSTGPHKGPLNCTVCLVMVVVSQRRGIAYRRTAALIASIHGCCVIFVGITYICVVTRMVTMRHTVGRWSIRLLHFFPPGNTEILQFISPVAAPMLHWLLYTIYCRPFITDTRLKCHVEPRQPITGSHFLRLHFSPPSNFQLQWKLQPVRGGGLEVRRARLAGRSERTSVSRMERTDRGGPPLPLNPRRNPAPAPVREQGSRVELQACII